MATAQLALVEPVQNSASGPTDFEGTLATALRRLDAVVRLSVKDRDLTDPPADPADGDRYIPAATATGAWTGLEGYVVMFHGGAWISITPREGWTAWVDDENCIIAHNGTAWSQRELGKVATSITASVTQTQGQQPLTAHLNVVTTCANTNDTVTMPAAAEGRECIVVNQGAETLKVFPASGDAIDAASANTATTLAAGVVGRFGATDATHWYSV